jgi:hypothetical protein
VLVVAIVVAFYLPAESQVSRLELAVILGVIYGGPAGFIGGLLGVRPHNINWWAPSRV